MNPFIMATKNVLGSFGVSDVVVGKPYISDPRNSGDKLLISVGVTGEIRGQVVFELDTLAAKGLASTMMMGMPVDELDEMAKSAVSEMSNMIMGNAATGFAEIPKRVDITPPTVFTGSGMTFSTPDAKMICIPLNFNNSTVDINIALKEV